MKKLIIIINLILFVNCVSQTKYNTLTNLKSTCMEKRPIITPKTDTLNFSNFKDKITYTEYTTKYKNPSVTINNYNGKFTDYLGLNIFSGNEIIGYSHTIYINNSFYNVSRSYYPNFQLKRKLLYYDIQFNNSVPLGREYNYDEQGKIINVINHDNGYNFCIENVLNSLKNIYKEKLDVFGETQKNIFVTRKSSQKNKYWEIKINKARNNNSRFLDILRFDGKTGELFFYISYKSFGGTEDLDYRPINIYIDKFHEEKLKEEKLDNSKP